MITDLKNWNAAVESSDDPMEAAGDITELATEILFCFDCDHTFDFCDGLTAMELFWSIDNAKRERASKSEKLRVIERAELFLFNVVGVWESEIDAEYADEMEFIRSLDTITPELIAYHDEAIEDLDHRRGKLERLIGELTESTVYGVLYMNWA